MGGAGVGFGGAWARPLETAVAPGARPWETGVAPGARPSETAVAPGARPWETGVAPGGTVVGNGRGTRHGRWKGL